MKKSSHMAGLSFLLRSVLFLFGDFHLCLFFPDFGTVDQIQGKAYEDHAAYNVAQSYGYQVIQKETAPVQRCQLGSSVTVSGLGSLDIGGICRGEDGCGDVVHIGHTMLISADNESQNGEENGPDLAGNIFCGCGHENSHTDEDIAQNAGELE